MSLRDRAASGIFWSAFERFGQQGCAFLVQLVLARLLLPEQFGLIAMVTVFVTISNVLIDAGFSRALVQRKDVTDSDISTVFFFNLLVSIVLAVTLLYVAPTVAAFYEQAQLTEILRFLSCGLILAAFGATHRSLLSRQLQFKKLFWVSFPSTIVSGAIGIALALQDYGVWALVGQALSMQFVSSLFLWFQSGWRPSLVFDLKCLKEMFPYGSRLALSSLLDQGFANIYVLVIGKSFAPVDVGFFQRARSFQQLPVQNMQAILGRVTFPLFSKLQDDPPRMKRGMRKAIQIVSLFVFSGMGLLAAIAEPMVVTLIGDKWLPCVPYLQALCVVGAMYPIHAMNLNLLASVGRSDLFLRLEVIKKVLVVLNISLTFQIGVQAMIYGMIVTSLVGMYINTHYTKRLIDYSLFEQLKNVLRNALLGTCVLFSAYLAGGLIIDNALLDLLVRLFAGGLVFCLGIRFLESSLKSELGQMLLRLPGGVVVARLLF